MTVQLIDASDGNHLWSETYDRDLSAADVFAIQDDITARVATTIGDQYGVISRTGIEETRRKGPDNLSSYDCVLKKYEYDRLITEEAHISARDCLEMAVKRDANYAEAWAALSEMYAESHTTGFNPIERPVERALETAKKPNHSTRPIRLPSGLWPMLILSRRTQRIILLTSSERSSSIRTMRICWVLRDGA